MLQFARMHLPMVKKTRSQKFALKGDSKQVSHNCLQNIWAFRICCSFLNVNCESNTV